MLKILIERIRTYRSMWSEIVEFVQNKEKYKRKSYGELVGEQLKKNFGKHSYACEGFYSYSKDTKVGAFCSIGQNVMLSTSHHPKNFLSTSPFCYFEDMGLEGQEKFADFNYINPVIVGNDCWIGNNAVVMDGVKICDGAIIGTNSVVTRDVPPYAIVAGCPAKIIGYRFDNQVIDDLMNLKWWELDDDTILKLPFDNIYECIKSLKKIRNVEGRTN